MRNLLILKGTFCSKNDECKESAQQYRNKEVEGETRWQRRANAKREKMAWFGEGSGC